MRKHGDGVRSGASSTSSTPPASPAKKVAGGGGGGGFTFPRGSGSHGWEGWAGEGDTDAVFKMLEEDGFDPSEASSEEVMVHLWRINQKSKEKLRKEKVSAREKGVGVVRKPRC